MTAHVHAALMAEYAKDAAETDKPWERWETGKEGYQWKNLLQHPDWNIYNRYRRKQKTKTVYQWAVTLTGESWQVTGSLYSSEEELKAVWTSAIKVLRLDHTAIEVPY